MLVCPVALQVCTHTHLDPSCFQLMLSQMLENNGGFYSFKTLCAVTCALCVDPCLELGSAALDCPSTTCAQITCKHSKE